VEHRKWRSKMGSEKGEWDVVAKGETIMRHVRD